MSSSSSSNGFHLRRVSVSLQESKPHRNSRTYMDISIASLSIPAIA